MAKDEGLVVDMTGPSWRCDGRSDAVERARQWIASRDLGAVLGAFGCDTDPEDWSALAAWSSGVLDTRSGGERQLAAPAVWDEHQVDVLLRSARPLGLLATAAPGASSYDCTAVMGGTVTAHRLRSGLVRAIHDGGVGLGVVVALAAARQLLPWESASHDDVRHDVEWEWADLAEVLAVEFDLLPGVAVSSAAPVDVSIGSVDGRELRALAAPASFGRTRADTADAFACLSERVEFRRLLVITSAIYAPYTFFVGARVLDTPFEIVGTPTSTEGDRADLAQRLAQEIHSTISAINAL
jgi:hypothetical protein